MDLLLFNKASILFNLSRIFSVFYCGGKQESLQEFKAKLSE